MGRETGRPARDNLGLPHRPERPRRRPAVDQVIPSLAQLLDPFRGCFRQEAFLNFQHVFVAWLLCPGTRTLTEVWQVCSLRSRRHFTAIYHLFAYAKWDW